MRTKTISSFKNGLIVSCQALKHEPLFGAGHMAAMAAAAEAGGAAAIRANTPRDIEAIKKSCSLLVIGLYKMDYPDSPVYITPTIREAEAIVEAGADLIAVDATRRTRPDGETLSGLLGAIRARWPDRPVVADVSTFEEGAAAMDLGFDLISTTMSGYTPYSPQQEKPDIDLVARLASLGRKPVLAEGRIWTPAQCAACLRAGAHAVVVGTAITRPQEITRKFVNAIRSSVPFA
ncbi:N-acetylmannosamine-6-phosphate 2-epimerase [Paenibacillus humicola]|uniref:N-acetylmannosamine-6-phosphate 2-epimerase n=1 Tax=Paenibacillus humicola TaxID=3110540 RepID=UPI00237C36AC|nr:N-acetylmannosamine-6-phosphate 2-epimerase [Paenibacillus humicola]